MAELQPNAGWLAGAISAIKGLSWTNLLVIFALLLMLIPAYVVYRALNDEALLDRFLSSYREVPSTTGCTVRVVAERGGPERWSISTAYAAQGADRWTVGVILDSEPKEEQIESYCAALNLIVDRLHQ